MSASTGKCSECGHALRREKDALKTRRHWKLLLVAVLFLVAAYVLSVESRIRNSYHGWKGALPTTVWLLSSPLWGQYDGEYADEMLRRAMANGMWEWQIDWFVKKYVRASAQYDDSPELIYYLEAIGMMQASNREVLDLAIGSSQHEDGGVRSAAAYVLGRTEINDDRIVTVMSRMLDDMDESVRFSAALRIAVAEKPSDKYLQKLVNTVREDGSDRVRLECAIAICKIEHENSDAVEVIIDQLSRGVYANRVRSVLGLSYIDRSHYRKLVQGVRTALRDSNATIRRLALGYLSEVEWERNLLAEMIVGVIVTEVDQNVKMDALGWIIELKLNTPLISTTLQEMRGMGSAEEREAIDRVLEFLQGIEEESVD